MRTEYFKITAPTGEVEHEVRAGRVPSEFARMIRETRGPGFTVGMTTTPPAEVREAHGEFAGIVPREMVYVTHIGVRKCGRVVKVGRTRAHVEVATYGGKATKVIVRPIAEIEL